MKNYSMTETCLDALVLLLDIIKNEGGLHWNVDDVNQEIDIVDLDDGGRVLYTVGSEDGNHWKVYEG